MLCLSGLVYFTFVSLSFFDVLICLLPLLHRNSHAIYTLDVAIVAHVHLSIVVS